MPTAATYQALTKAELDRLARDRGLPGRSRLTKAELVEALERSDLGPDGLELLVAQHDRIRALFAAAPDRDGRVSPAVVDRVRELVAVVVKHTEIEELVLYPAVADLPGLGSLAGGRGPVAARREEHRAAERLLWELAELPVDAAGYVERLEDVREHVLQHLDAEEAAVFDAAREALSEERRRELGAALVRAWRVSPSRPHPPGPPVAAPGGWLAGLPRVGLALAAGASSALTGRLRSLTRHLRGSVRR